MTDKEFDFRIQLILKGDKDGLKAVYDEYAAYIYRTFVGIVRSPQDAEDLTADFFLRLWQKADRYKCGNGHKKYLAQIAHNMAVDFLKKQGRTVFTLDDDEKGFDIEDSVRTDDRVEDGISVGEAISRLSDDEREIVDLKVGLDLTFREIAQITGKPLGSVTWKYRRALDKLRKFVKEGAAL